MATEWYYETMGEVVGPLKASELIHAIRIGKIDYDTPIRKNDSQWVPAHQVNGLLEVALREVTEYYCPFCGARISQPPVDCRNCNRHVHETYLVKAAFPASQRYVRALVEPVKEAPIGKVTDWARSLFRKHS